MTTSTLAKDLSSANLRLRVVSVFWVVNNCQVEVLLMFSRNLARRWRIMSIRFGLRLGVVSVFRIGNNSQVVVLV